MVLDAVLSIFHDSWTGDHDQPVAYLNFGARLAADTHVYETSLWQGVGAGGHIQLSANHAVLVETRGICYDACLLLTLS